MDNKEATSYLYKIYRLFRKKEIPVILKKMRAISGQTDGKNIWLNPKTEIIPTFIHECLHILYPDWCESKVIRYENLIFNKLTERQLRNLLQKIIERIN